jgi:hypothetical protein
VHSLVNNGGTAICTLLRTTLGALRTHVRLAHKTVGMMVSPVPPEKTPDSSLPREERSWCIVASDWTEEQSSSSAWFHNLREENAHNFIIALDRTKEQSSAPMQNHSFGIAGTSPGSRSSGCLFERLEGFLVLGTLPEQGAAIECGELGRLLFRDCILLGAMYWSP